MERIPRIVILGAGYGGIVTAIRLQKELNYNEADVTLINKHDYHYMKTHLHMPAAGTGQAKNVKINILNLIDEFKIDFVKSTVVQIRQQDKKVILTDGTLSYDYLVIALGGETPTFGIRGLEQHALTIQSVNSVRLIKEHIEYQFAKFKREPNDLAYLSFIIGGGGFTGIEFAAQLADRIPLLCKKFDVDEELVQIHVVESKPEILSQFDSELAKYAKQVLTNKKVQFHVSTVIEECNSDGVIMQNDQLLPGKTIIWTGGVIGNELIEDAGFDVKEGRIEVDSYLRIPDYEEIYVIGDCSLTYDKEHRALAPTAQLATQQGYACAASLVANVRGKVKKPFRYEHKGTILSLGKGEAVGLVGQKKITGYAAVRMKRMIDLRYLYMIGGLPLVLRKGRIFKMK